MTKGKQFLKELQAESKASRAMLALVPLDKKDWAPHAKSMKMGRLATHIAEIAGWTKETLLQDELDFEKSEYKPFTPENTEDLLKYFDEKMQVATDILDSISDEVFNGDWTMRQGEMIFFTQNKADVMRTWVLNHIVHHRAQLGTYLRQLDISLPSTYGPTADSQSM